MTYTKSRRWVVALLLSSATMSMVPLTVVAEEHLRFKRITKHERVIPEEIAGLLVMGTGYIATERIQESSQYPEYLRKRPFAEIIVFQALGSALMFSNELPRYVRLAHALFQRFQLKRALGKKGIGAQEVVRLRYELSRAQHEIDYLKPRLTKKGVGFFIGRRILSALVHDLYKRGDRSVIGRYAMKGKEYVGGKPPQPKEKKAPVGGKSKRARRRAKRR